MDPESVERRLAAILSADAVGCPEPEHKKRHKKREKRDASDRRRHGSSCFRPGAATRSSYSTTLSGSTAKRERSR